MAFQTLFDLWDVTGPPEADVRFCQHAESSGLLCLSGRGGLQELLRLNHPAVLRFQDAQGQSYYATLTAVRDQTATVYVGTQSRTLSLAELDQRWRGDFTLFWRAPPQYIGSLQVGDRGPVVDWLRLEMARVEGRPATASEESKVFDPSFLEVVKRFQTANGLKSDGIVGPQTIIRLNAEVYSGDPHLTHVRKDG
jgi:general secretion pathway protein A